MGITVVVLFSVLVFTLTTDKLYKSEAVLLPVENTAGGLASAFSASPLSAFIGGGGLGAEGKKLMAVLKSRSVAEKVIKKINLVATLNPNLWDWEMNRWKDPEHPPEVDMALGPLSLMMSFTENARDGIIYIVAVCKDPKLAADIVNAYVEEVSSFLNSRSLNANFQVLDPAKVPRSHFKPNLKMNLLLSFVIGVFIATFKVLLAAYIKRLRLGNFSLPTSEE